MATLSKNNQMKTVAERNAELEPFGRKIISHEALELISTSTTVTVECLSCASQKISPLANFRKRTCGACGQGTSFGERLVYALVKHYIVDDAPQDWVVEMPVVGLDPHHPELVLKFDLASSSRRVAFEVHSDYHRNPHKRFHTKKLTLTERRRRDLLKTKTVEGGQHTSGPLEGWSIAVVWFELERCKGLGLKGNYLPVVIEEFKSEATRAGLTLRSDNIDITYDDLYGSIEGSTVQSVLELGFERRSEVYEGDGKEYVWRHKTCGGEFQAPAYEILKNAVTPNHTGCKWCDRTGWSGNWLDFLGRIAKYDLAIKEEYRLQIHTEFQPIPGIYCTLHPEEVLKEQTRAAWNNKLGRWDKRTDDYDLRHELCDECAKQITPKQKASPVETKWRERFLAVGYTLDSTLTPGQKGFNGRQTATIALVACIGCGTQQKISRPPQRLSKVEKSLVDGGRGLSCINKSCSQHIKKGPKPKL